MHVCACLGREIRFPWPALNCACLGLSCTPRPATAFLRPIRTPVPPGHKTLHSRTVPAPVATRPPLLAIALPQPVRPSPRRHSERVPHFAGGHGMMSSGRWYAAQRKPCACVPVRPMRMPPAVRSRDGPWLRYERRVGQAIRRKGRAAFALKPVSTSMPRHRPGADASPEQPGAFADEAYRSTCRPPSKVGLHREVNRLTP